MGRKELELTGRRFGRLVVEGRADTFVETGGHATWKCYCDCGATHYARGTNLSQGKITRCRRCSKAGIDAAAAKTVVDIWCMANGEQGGYATAVDDLGTPVAHTPWTRKALAHPIVRCAPLGWIMDKLVEIERVAPRKPRESMAHWCQRTGVTVRPRLYTATAAMHGGWYALTGEWRGGEDGLRFPAPTAADNMLPQQSVRAGVGPLDTTAQR